MGALLGSGLCEISDGVHTDGVAVVLEDAGEGGGGTIAFVSLGDHGDGVNEVVPIWVGGYGIAGALGERFCIEGLMHSPLLSSIGEQVDGNEFFARPTQAKHEVIS